MVRDPFHRSWNDAILVLRHRGLWWCGIFVIAAFLVPHGPFDGHGWHGQAKEAAATQWAFAP
eukprot:9764019-Lingulodinium_polyedra.AAC.1